MKLIAIIFWLFVIFCFIKWAIEDIRVDGFKRYFSFLIISILFCGLGFVVSKFLSNKYMGFFIMYIFLSLFATLFPLMDDETEKSYLFIKEYLVGVSLLFLFGSLGAILLIIKPNNLWISSIGSALLILGVCLGVPLSMYYILDETLKDKK